METRRKWSRMEEAALRRYYGSNDQHKLTKILCFRSINSIMIKAHRMGLSRAKWLKEQVRKEPGRTYKYYQDKFIASYHAIKRICNQIEEDERERMRMAED